MTDDRIYEGYPSGKVMWFDRISGESGPLCPEQLRAGVPAGLYEWGKPGLGSHFLALALLMDALESELLPGLWAEQFAVQVVAQLPAGGWTLTRLEIFGWLIMQLEEELCGGPGPGQDLEGEFCAEPLGTDEGPGAFFYHEPRDSDDADE